MKFAHNPVAVQKEDEVAKDLVSQDVEPKVATAVEVKMGLLPVSVEVVVALASEVQRDVARKGRGEGEVQKDVREPVVRRLITPNDLSNMRWSLTLTKTANSVAMNC